MKKKLLMAAMLTGCMFIAGCSNTGSSAASESTAADISGTENPISPDSETEVETEDETETGAESEIPVRAEAPVYTEVENPYLYDYEESDYVIRDRFGGIIPVGSVTECDVTNTYSGSYTDTYDEYGQLKERLYEDGSSLTSDNTYDEAGHMLEMNIYKDGQLTDTEDFTWDENGNLLSQTGSMYDFEYSYTYGENNKPQTGSLTQALVNNGYGRAMSVAYSYDENELLLEKNFDAAGGSDNDIEGDIRTYTYDAEGWLVCETIEETYYDWDADQEVTNKTTVTYVYDSADHRMLSKTVVKETAEYGVSTWTTTYQYN